MQKKNQYQPPQLTVVTFKAERGYAASNIDLAADAVNHFIEERVAQGNMWVEESGVLYTDNIESRTDQGSFGGGWATDDGSWF